MNLSEAAKLLREAEVRGVHQAYEVYYALGPEAPAWCAVGYLLETAGVTWPSNRVDFCSYEPKETARIFGLPLEIVQEMISMNDHQQLSFKEIADTIDAIEPERDEYPEILKELDRVFKGDKQPA